MLHFARRIAFRVDIGQLLQFQRTLQRHGKQRPTPEEKHIARLGDFHRHGADIAIAFQHCGGVGRHLQQRCGQCSFLFGGDGAAGAAKPDGKAGQHCKLCAERFGRSNRDFRPRHGDHRRIAFARHGAFRHIHNGKDALPTLLQEPKGREGIGGLPTLAQQQRAAARRQGWVAVTQFTGKIRIHGQARHFFNPIAPDQTRQISTAASGHDQARDCDGIKGQFGQNHAPLRRFQIARERIAQHHRMFVQFLFHEVAVIALAGRRA